MSSGAPEGTNAPKLFIFDGPGEGRVLVSAGDAVIPAGELRHFSGFLEASGAVARSESSDLWGVIAGGGVALDGFRFISRRDLPAAQGMEIFRRSGAAYQMMNLCLKNRFCGSCGKPMMDHKNDLARYCQNCGNTVYPVLSCAVIVAVERGARILLGHNVSFPAGRYSLLAGFVEPGEALEDAIKREIFEESGVTIKNIRYFGSQPWPFPSSMMIGFIAEWESGEPRADGGELSDVRWFSAADLPDLPPPISISRQLIDDWLSRVS
jgi:NAD+ diphosphatase